MPGALYLVTSLLCFGFSLGIVYVNPKRVINQTFLLIISGAGLMYFCAGMAAIAAADFPERQTPALSFWLRSGSAISALLPWNLILMQRAITQSRIPLVTHIRRTWPYLLLCLALATLPFTEAFIPASSTPQNPERGPAYLAWTSILGGLFLWSLGTAFREMRRTSGIERIEAQFFLLHSSATCLFIFFLNFAARALDRPILTQFTPLVLVALFSMLVWALTQYRIFDTQQSLRGIARLLTLAGILAIGALAFSKILAPLLAHPGEIILSVILSAILVLSFDRASLSWFRIDQDQLVAPARAKIIELSRTEPDPEKLRTLFEATLQDWCQTSLAELIIAGENSYDARRTLLSRPAFNRLVAQGWLTPEHLARVRPHGEIDQARQLMEAESLAALLAVPRGSHRPSLILALGIKFSLRPYTYPDITQLINLAELMDNILSHARIAAGAAKLARMESMTLMSRSLAHDLNNLTTPVSAYLIHMENKVRPGTVEAEVYSAARHSIGVMQDYIRESLFFARKLRPEFKPFTVSEIFIAALPLAQKRATKRQVSLETSTPSLIPMNGDPVLIQRLLANLINNAIEASSVGDTVRVSASLHRGTHVAITVADRGCGVQPENIRRIFEPYFTTKDTGDDVRGIGLGLAICQKIADLHGGEIEVKNLSPKGTAFTVILPLQPESPGPNSATT